MILCALGCVIAVVSLRVDDEAVPTRIVAAAVAELEFDGRVDEVRAFEIGTGGTTSYVVIAEGEFRVAGPPFGNGTRGVMEYGHGRVTVDENGRVLKLELSDRPATP